MKSDEYILDKLQLEQQIVDYYCTTDRSKEYLFPKSYVSYRKPKAISTEQRERARQVITERNKANKI